PACFESLESEQRLRPCRPLPLPLTNPASHASATTLRDASRAHAQALPTRWNRATRLHAPGYRCRPLRRRHHAATTVWSRSPLLLPLRRLLPFANRAPAQDVRSRRFQRLALHRYRAGCQTPRVAVPNRSSPLPDAKESRRRSVPAQKMSVAAPFEQPELAVQVPQQEPLLPASRA